MSALYIVIAIVCLALAGFIWWLNTDAPGPRDPEGIERERDPLCTRGPEMVPSGEVPDGAYTWTRGERITVGVLVVLGIASLVRGLLP